MLQQLGWWTRGRFLFIALLGGLTLGLWPAQAVRAGDLGKLDTSLKWIPADAASYTVWLRNREQLDAVLKSNAWAKLKALPALQMAVQMAQAELQKPENPLAQVQSISLQCWQGAPDKGHWLSKGTLTVPSRKPEPAVKVLARRRPAELLDIDLGDDEDEEAKSKLLPFRKPGTVVEDADVPVGEEAMPKRLAPTA